VFRTAIGAGSRVRLPRAPSTREGAYFQIVRVLVTVSPLMYREAIALSLHQRRPDFEVRIAPPEAAEKEVRGFGPHLLVHNDTDGLDRSVLEGVPCWVEVQYSDSMDAKISVDGRLEEFRDISTDDLLRAADEVVARVRRA
jgi:hypothetical protein